MKTYLIPTLALAGALSLSVQSCKDDEAKSSNCRIESFTFEQAPIVKEQPKLTAEDASSGTFTFKLTPEATPGAVDELVPTIVVSPFATIDPPSGIKQKFSAGVVYTVTAPDGTFRKYTVQAPARQMELRYSLDTWRSEGTGRGAHDEPAEEGLATSSTGALFLNVLNILTGYPVLQETDEVVAGAAAAKLVTLDNSKKVTALYPAIVPGSLFTGTFSLDMLDRLNSTKFGVPYNDLMPVAFKGWYKYLPGEIFYDGKGATTPDEVKILDDVTDECAIQAVLYEAEDLQGKEVTLTGNTINTSPFRVAVASLKEGGAQEKYTAFEIPFEYLPGQTFIKGKKYKMAIVCSSSKEGDDFRGAGGSTLYLDELEIVSDMVD
ncbi:MAG: PCMD domain-containing protein [Prevotellaceae bacterium]|jgi:hypothetical protein|nr:PCMD domain-containing protein [Prevotellaceae bacterium]